MFIGLVVGRNDDQSPLSHPVPFLRPRPLARRRTTSAPTVASTSSSANRVMIAPRRKPGAENRQLDRPGPGRQGHGA